MFKRIIKIILAIFFIAISSYGTGSSFVNPKKVEASLNLNGRILLQVEDKGQAWYVNPLNSQRYYLGRPDDAFQIMRSLGLGVSNSDINSFSLRAPSRLSGRILLKVQDKGQAYYVDPISLKLFYLGRPADAFSVMRLKGLGISNQDLATITIASVDSLKSVAASSSTGLNVITSEGRNFSFKYQNKNYELLQGFSATIYNSYKNSTKTYSYIEGKEPANLRDVFYALFLKLKSDDSSLDEIIAKLKKIANDNSWTEDQLVEFTLAFVQYIPYDQAKISADFAVNNNPYFPYETLYLDKGVCSDKTFLAVALLRKLGYGAAILDFPDRNHTALGIACPKEFSLNNSGYCYGETTNYFPLGVIPQSIDAGQAQTAENFTNLFNSTNLGKIEIYQETSGKIYQGMPTLYSKVESLRNSKIDIDAGQSEVTEMGKNIATEETSVNVTKKQLELYYANGQIREYNSLVLTYNSQVEKYNSDLSIYQSKVNEYNLKVAQFNLAVRTFYQQ